MDERLTISTPEQVAVHYNVAGIGSRLVASLIDHIIVALALLLVNCAILALVPAIGFGSLFSGGQDMTPVFVAMAILTLVSFLILWGYFALFETVWGGQTPGKRAGHLRVIRRSGETIGASEALVRNLLRLVDFLPGFYGIGLIAMFIDKDARRLGDLAAGTIVVVEGGQTSLRDVRTASDAGSPYFMPQAYGAHSSLLGAQTAPVARPDPLPGVSLRALAPDDFWLIRELLGRIGRGDLDSQREEELTAKLAYALAARVGHDFSNWQTRGWQPTTFLQAVLDAREARGE